MNFINDTSTQAISSITTSGTYDGFAFNSSLNNYQPLLTSSTNLLGVGSSISALNWNSITLNRPTNFQADWNSTVINRPTNFQADWNSTVINRPTIPATLTFTSPLVNTANTITFNESSITTLTNFYNRTQTDNLLNAKQNNLTASTTLLGIGSNLTLINYNTLSNLPTNFQADWNTTVINRPTIPATLTFTSPLVNTANTITFNESSITTLTNFYNRTQTDNLLNAKQNTLTASTTLAGIGSNLTLVNYNTLSNRPTNFQADWNSTVINRPTNFQADWNSTVINRPTNFQADWNTTVINRPTIPATLTFTSPLVNTANTITFNESSITTLTNFYNRTQTDTLLNAKQNTLTASTTLLGIGSNLTLINYNTLSNLPNLGLYLTTSNASTTYLPLTGGTLTGSLTVPSSINISGATTSPQSLFFRGQDYNIGIAGSAGNYSSSAIQNDMIIRTLTGTNLYLQCGTGGHALRIHTNNKISTTGDLTLGNGAWLSVGSGNLPTCPLNVGNNVVSNRIISLYDLANNNFQFTGFGNNNGLSFNIPASTNNFRFLVGQSSTSSTEVLRINGNGDLLLLAPNIQNPLTIAEQRIINNGSFLSAVFGGDSLISSFWGVAININSGGLGDSGNAGATKIVNSASFTINTRSSDTTTSFDRTLFNVRNNGRVGIGSTNPQQLLDIFSDNTSVNCHIRIRANTAREAGIFLDRSASSWNIAHKGTGFTGSVDNLGFLNNSASSILELTQGGNVGIGSAAPLTKLEVSGTTPTVAIKGSNEADRAILYFATPFTNTSAYKCALIAEGMSTWSRSKLHFCLDNTGDNTSTFNASLTNSRMTINYDGSVGIGNSLSTAPLWIGRPDIASNGFIVISRNSGGNRNALIGYTSSFFISIGDYGNVNSTANTNVPQFVMIYNAPSSSIFVETSGRTVFQYGFGTSSDERIKTNIKTIENALDKVLLLRGVEYNDIRIEPDEKRFGLIAQEVELIIPEIVNDNEHLKHKTLDYVSLIPYLIEAVKEQQKQINKMKELLQKNNII